jgi:hypothetical protein
MKLTRLILRKRAKAPVTARMFSQSFVKSSPVAGMFNDDDFLPDIEELEIEHQKKLDSIIQVSKKPDDMLRHNEDVGGILYKYDLPIENKPIVFRSELVVKEEVPLTATESLFDAL